MKEEDLKISGSGGDYTVIVRGRANFEYAVPLRELARSLDETFSHIRIFVSECVTMDSTFMGVLSMIALKGIRTKAKVELCNAPDNVRKLLRDLGVARLFCFVEAEEPSAEAGNEKMAEKSDMLTTAETVSEAHKTLVSADETNRAKFEDVIRYADADVERLRKEGN